MEQILKVFDKIVIIISSILLIILIGCLSVLPIAKSKSFFMKEHERNNVVDILNEYTFTGQSHTQFDENGNEVIHYYPNYNIDESVVLEATEHIIDYLYHSDVESMQFQVQTPEGEIDFFTTQAIIHMKDVKVLFIGGINLCFISLGLFLLCILYFIFRYKYVKKILYKWYSITITIFISFILVVAIYAIFDFDGAFTLFHYIIFNSKDAEIAISFSYYDTLTNVLTTEFFMHIGIIIALNFIGLLALSIVIGKLLNRYGNKIYHKLIMKKNPEM